MKPLNSLRGAAALMLTAGLVTSALAQKPGEDHDSHHPQPPTLPAPTAAPMAAAPAPSSDGVMRTMDGQLQAMQAMHEKLAAARTPQERQALLDEHLRVMREAMGAMQGMSGMSGGMQGMGGMGGMGMGAMQGQGSAMGMPPGMMQHHQVMEKRMDMMTSMMQMMMDRLPPAPSK